MKSKSSALVLFSGGMDSTVCLYMARRKHSQVIPLHFDYGQTVTEETAARLIDPSTVTLKLPNLYGVITFPAHSYLENDTPAFVPNRNTIFLALAANEALRRGIKNIYFGAVGDSHYPDCSKTFVSKMQSLLCFATKASIKLHAPLLEMTKAQVAEYVVAHSVLSSMVALSVSCYESLKACGKCPACIARAKAFEDAGLNDPSRWLVTGKLP